MSAVPGSDRDVLERIRALRVIGYDVTMLNIVAENIHRLNDHFYRDIDTGERLNPHPAEKIALIHSEVSEMLEGARKGLPDDHLPHRSAEEVEAADVFIRLMDYIGWRGLDIREAVKEKLAYNETRSDHTNEARRASGGKKF